MKVFVSMLITSLTFLHISDQCIGNDVGFKRCSQVFWDDKPAPYEPKDDTADYCFESEKIPVYAVYYNCKERIPIWCALKVSLIYLGMYLFHKPVSACLQYEYAMTLYEFVLNA